MSYFSVPAANRSDAMAFPPASWPPTGKLTSVASASCVAGQIAYTRARDSLSLIPRAPAARSGQAGGEATHFAGHRITIYRKQPDGRWLLARDAHTVTPVKTTMNDE
jgi:ketosteroid isomerase-like protein